MNKLQLFAHLTGEQDNILNPYNADACADALEFLADANSEELQYLQKALRKNTQLIKWLESISEADADAASALNIQKEHLESLQDEIAKCKNKLLLAREFKRLLQGSSLLEASTVRMQSHYTKAIAFAIGNKNFHSACKNGSAWKKYLRVQKSTLAHKIERADEGFGWHGEELHHLNGSLYIRCLQEEKKWLAYCEKKASDIKSIDANNLMPIELWNWVNWISKQFKETGKINPISVEKCPLGGAEVLAKIYGRAHVIHNTLGSIATSNKEKQKEKAGLYETQYISHKKTVSDAYVLDAEGNQVMAGFRKPRIKYKKLRSDANYTAELSARNSEYDPVKASLAILESRKFMSFYQSLQNVAISQIEKDKKAELKERILLDMKSLQEIGIDYMKI